MGTCWVSADNGGQSGLGRFASRHHRTDRRSAHSRRAGAGYRLGVRRGVDQRAGLLWQCDLCCRTRVDGARDAIHEAFPVMNNGPKGNPLRVGIGGPVGSGKAALMDWLCKTMRGRHEIAAITNDIYTREDAEFLTRSGALPPERIRGVETGGCPHTAIRED